MFSPPPLSFIHIPFDVSRVIINDAFYEAPHATIHSVLKATISGTHVTEVLGGTQGWRVCDQAPEGVWEKVVTPPPQRARYSGHTCSQQLPPHGPLRGIEFALPLPPKAKPVYTKTRKAVNHGHIVASQG